MIGQKQFFLSILCVLPAIVIIVLTIVLEPEVSAKINGRGSTKEENENGSVVDENVDFEKYVTGEQGQERATVNSPIATSASVVSPSPTLMPVGSPAFQEIEQHQEISNGETPTKEPGKAPENTDGQGQEAAPEAEGNQDLETVVNTDGTTKGKTDNVGTGQNVETGQGTDVPQGGEMAP